MNSKEYYNIERRLLILEEMICDIYDETIKEKRVCPVCNERIRLYLPAGVNLRKNAKCPVCKSMERHRFLWIYFQKNSDILNQEINKSILHFAAESFFLNYFKMQSNIDYYPVDIRADFPGIRDVVDIQCLKYEDNKFDFIICNHVLEHIPEDSQALDELFRVLKPGGVAYIMVPIATGVQQTKEDKSHNTSELRLMNYGQDDHVRHYGEDFIKRLSKFEVEVAMVNKMFSKDEITQYALIPDDKLFVCYKP